MEREGERREKNPFERLVTDKGGRGSPLSGDQPRTQRLFMTSMVLKAILVLRYVYNNISPGGVPYTPNY